jgi:hypothetical protein
MKTVYFILLILAVIATCTWLTLYVNPILGFAAIAVGVGILDLACKNLEKTK